MFQSVVCIVMVDRCAVVSYCMDTSSAAATEAIEAVRMKDADNCYDKEVVTTFEYSTTMSCLV